MTSFVFKSRVAVGRQQMKVRENLTDCIKNEPMLFSCSLEASLNLGGELTRDFLSLIPDDIKTRPDFIVDSRSHMLMPTWYSCIPGFHHDDVPRSNNGQPNYHNPEYHSQHVMGLMNGSICPTRFALGDCAFPDIEPGEVYYKKWHPIVVQRLQQNMLHEWYPPSGYPIYFDWQTWHEGTRAVDSGWRWFIRCSWNTHRKQLNELRRQVQVYLEFPMEGW